MSKIMRRSLLAAGGTLLAAAAARKYLFAGPDPAAADRSQAFPGPASQSPGPVPQSIDEIRAESPATLPPLRFTMADGTPRSLGDYAGKGIVLNFWATWCAPCVSEMPALEALSRKLAGQGAGKEIVVLPISLDRGGADAVRPFYAGHGIASLPVLLDPHSETMMALKLDGIPTTLVIDRNGREVARVQGPVRWDQDEAAAVIRRLVG